MHLQSPLGVQSCIHRSLSQANGRSSQIICSTLCVARNLARHSTPASVRPLVPASTEPLHRRASVVARAAQEGKGEENPSTSSGSTDSRSTGPSPRSSQQQPEHGQGSDRAEESSSSGATEAPSPSLRHAMLRLQVSATSSMHACMHASGMATHKYDACVLFPALYV